jgi:hypothetical protein
VTAAPVANAAATAATIPAIVAGRNAEVLNDDITALVYEDHLQLRHGKLFCCWVPVCHSRRQSSRRTVRGKRLQFTQQNEVRAPAALQSAASQLVTVGGNTVLTRKGLNSIRKRGKYVRHQE